MTRPIFIFAAFIAIAFIGCTNTTSEQQADSATFVQDTLSTSLPVPDYDYSQEDSIKSISAKQISNYDYLIGKWQNTEDTSNYIVFDDELRREKSAGMKEWEEEKFILSDACMNTSSKDNGEPKEKDMYISCPKSDLCWYILHVDKEKLSLSYVARGNTLNYKRVDDGM